jgi:hypothetical protein
MSWRRDRSFAGTVQNRQRSSPVIASRAATNPRRPEPPPPTPTTTSPFRHKRRSGGEISTLGKNIGLVPQDIAGSALKRNQMGVAGAEKQAVSEQGDTTVHAVFADANGTIMPDTAAGFRVERIHFVRVGDVHYAIKNQRGGLQLAGSVKMLYPLGHQRFHVAAIDLSKGAITLRSEVAGIGEPILSGTF